MTPHRIEFWGGLAFLLAVFFLLALFWPDDLTFRQALAEAAGLIGGSLSLLAWAIASLASTVLTRSHRREASS